MPLLVAPGCNFDGIAILEPAEGELETHPPVRLEARIARSVAADSVQARLDGVDLIQALGLVPPFEGATGDVLVGGAWITISDFRFDPAGGFPNLSLDATGLPLGTHEIAVSGHRPSDGADLAVVRSFTRIVSLDEKVRETTSAGLERPSKTVAGVRLGNAAAGDAGAGAPVHFPDGSELRAGVVEAIEARLAGGTP